MNEHPNHSPASAALCDLADLVSRRIAAGEEPHVTCVRLTYGLWRMSQLAPEWWAAAGAAFEADHVPTKGTAGQRIREAIDAELRRAIELAPVAGVGEPPA